MPYTESNVLLGSTRTCQQTWTQVDSQYYDYIDGFGKYVKVSDGTFTYTRKSIFRQFYDGPKNLSLIHPASWSYVDRENELTSVQAGKITYHGPASYCFQSYEPTAPKSPDSANIAARATNSVLSSLKDQKAHLPLIIAESRKTCDMFIDVAHTLAKVINTVRKGPRAIAYGLQKYRDPREVLDTLTAAQLLKEYGVKPLLMDLDASIRSLAELSYRPVFVTATGRGQDTCTTVFPPRSGGDARQRSASYLQSYSYKIWVEAMVDPGYQHSAASFGLVNPLEVAWELTPYSFVVDWFLPIGDAFSSLDATYGLSFSRGYSTSKTVNVYQRGSYKQTVTQYSREKLETFPSFTAIFSPDLSHQRLANAMSLLSKAISRK